MTTTLRVRWRRLALLMLVVVAIRVTLDAFGVTLTPGGRWDWTVVGFIGGLVTPSVWDWRD